MKSALYLTAILLVSGIVSSAEIENRPNRINLQVVSVGLPSWDDPSTLQFLFGVTGDSEFGEGHISSLQASQSILRNDKVQGTTSEY